MGTKIITFSLTMSLWRAKQQNDLNKQKDNKKTKKLKNRSVLFYYNTIFVILNALKESQY
ncbi:hypothetical protein CEY12_18310 [Chryseobacterium sp. T16E-39]|nr:hypothetical protein CEY12_18310 [Chryseobacterium sp. T16E-39]